MKHIILIAAIITYSLVGVAQEVTIKEKTKTKVQGPVKEKKIIKKEVSEPSTASTVTTSTTSHNAYNSRTARYNQGVKYRHYTHPKTYSSTHKRHYVSHSNHYAKVHHRHYVKTAHRPYKDVKRKSRNGKYKVKYKY